MQPDSDGRPSVLVDLAEVQAPAGLVAQLGVGLHVDGGGVVIQTGTTSLRAQRSGRLLFDILRPTGAVDGPTVAQPLVVVGRLRFDRDVASVLVQRHPYRLVA